MYSNSFKKKHEKVLSNLASSFNSVAQSIRQPTTLMLKSNATPTTNTTNRMNSLNLLINKRKNFLKSDQITLDRSVTMNEHSIPKTFKRNLTFENLNLLCPIALHYRIGFERHESGYS
jgi:hypothetical protein